MPPETAIDPPDAPSGLSAWWPVVLLFLVAAATYVALGSLVAVPIISPDEYAYGHLARSLADGDGLSWGGGDFVVRSAYLHILAPLWNTDDLFRAYEQSKALGAICASTVVFPVWLLARGFVGPRLALIPAALSVAGAWMTVTGLLLTENLAYPLGVASLAAMVPAVGRPGSRWAVGALGLAALASLARPQLIVLPAILLVAVLADVARHGSHWRERLREHRVVLWVALAVIVIGAVVIAASHSVLGRYSGLLDGSVALGDVVTGSRDELAALLVLTGMIPLLVTLAGSVRGDVWRDDTVAPLLAVTWSAAVVLVAQSGFGVAFWDTGWSIERYVVYCVPLLLVAFVVLLARSLVDWRRIAAVTGGAVVLALLIPGVRSYIEEPALFGLNRRMDAVLGTSTATSVTIVVIVLGLLVGLVVWRFAARPGFAVGLAALLTGAVLLVQSQATWAHRDASTEFWRAGFPADLSWVDAKAGGDVAHFVVFDDPFRHPITEFFNRTITRTYAFDQFPLGERGILGKVCAWSLAPKDGGVTFQPACGPPPTRLLLNDEDARVTFHDQRVLADERDVGRLIAIPQRKPRLLAFVQPSCGTPLPIIDNRGTAPLLSARPLKCAKSFGANLWLDAPATLVATFRGGTEPSSVSTGGRTYPLPAGRMTTIRLREPAGPTVVGFEVPAGGPPPQFPQLTSLVLREGGTATQLLY